MHSIKEWIDSTDEGAEGGHVECVRLLLDKGATVNRHDKVSAVCDLS